MKKRLLIAFVFFTQMTAFHFAKAQSESRFFASLSPGIAFNAPGKNISIDEPTAALEVGWGKKFILGLRMRALCPYSPSMKDSSAVFTSTGDSLNPFKVSYNDFYHKTATAAVFFGFLVGGEGKFACGGNIGPGVVFAEHDGVVKASAMVDYTLTVGYRINADMGIFVSSTYSYVWSHFQGFKTDGFAVVGQLTYMVFITGD